MATTLPSGGMIDPTKQAEYPVLLGDRLAGNNSNDAGSPSRLINLNYNYKTKSTSAQQRSTLARSSQSRDLYHLTITDKAPNAENTLTYVYEGSVDPARETGDTDGGQQAQEYALVFDADRKAFILEPVTAQLNFNLRSAPAKTEKQVMEQYEQLRTLQLEDQPASGDDQAQAPDGSVEEDDGPADDSNPYDFRHFLRKEGDDHEKSDVEVVAPDAHNKPSRSTPVTAATSKPAPKPKPRLKQSDPMRQKKAEPKKQPPAAKPSKPAKPEPGPEPQPEVEPAPAEPKSSPSDTGVAAVSSQKAAPSPGSNIIIDGDLIIDMGSPPPTRRTFNINPAHFSSNNTPNGEEEDEGGRDDEMMDDFRLPSPVGDGRSHSGDGEQLGEHEEGITPGAPGQEEDEVEDDDALAAEMEAAFEESAREEEPASTHSYQQRPYNAPSDDESEVSEEE